MPLSQDSLRVLVVSNSDKMSQLLIDTLPSNQFHPISHATTAGEAKRLLIENHFDIVVINTPLTDDFGIQTALDMAHTETVGILLLVKNDIFDQVSYKVEDLGVVTIPKPTSKQTLYTSIKMLSAMQYRIHLLKKETLTLRNKMDEIKIITRAKWLLIDQLNMTEPQAHRHIEKQAMDRCVRKLDIAENIIRTYER